MYVGIIQVDLEIPGATNLKDKRRVVRSIKDRLRNRFQVATAEVGVLDNCREASLGISLVSNDAAHAQKRCQSILNFLEKQREAAVADTQVEIL